MSSFLIGGKKGVKRSLPFYSVCSCGVCILYKGESHGKVPEEREMSRSNGLTGGLCGVNVCNCVFGSVGVFAQPVYLFDGWALPCGLLQF